LKSVLKVENLSVYYPLRGGLLNRVKGNIKAVDEVSFEVEEGTTFGIAGESGSGKTTLCMSIARLIKPTRGRVIVDGQDYAAAKGAKLKELRSRLQIVFQNPLSSLDPHMDVSSIVLEPLKALKKPEHTDSETTVKELLEKVGLRASLAKRFPHELSGGQGQRVSIARALSVSPGLLILDEPTSALDASVQAQILNLFNELQRDLGMTYLLVSHDLAVIGHMSDQVAIMYAGKFVEKASFREVFYSLGHPYTGALLGFAHLLGRLELEEKFTLKGEMPSPRNPPPGCTLHPRCPFASEICRREYPPLQPMKRDTR
jgi:oligopeptide/dipeptide ABC transporter ATP-binding protein